MAKDGKDFAELAVQFSEGPTAKNGGSLGAFRKEAMVKPFSDKAFAMQAGEISEPVRTRFGWHIIKVEKVNEAKTLSLEDARKKITDKLTLERARTRDAPTTRSAPAIISGRVSNWSMSSRRMNRIKRRVEAKE